MTIVQQAIGELETYRGLIDRALESLRALAQLEAHVYEAGTRTAPATRLVTTEKPSKPTTTGPPERPHRPQTGSMAHQVAKVLKRRGPMSPREIRAAGNMTSSQVGYGLQVLRQQKLVTADGITNNRRYQLVPDFEVVWSGTKERNGEAPSLLASRDSRGLPS